MDHRVVVQSQPVGSVGSAKQTFFFSVACLR